MQFNNIYPTIHPPEATYPALDPFYTPHPALSPTPSDSALANDAITPMDALVDTIQSTPESTPESTPTTNALDHFFTGKKRFLAKTVEELMGEIYARESLKESNLRAITYESCQIGSRILEIDHWQTGLDPGIDKTRSTLEGQRMSLDRERRFEQIACWRDTTRLKSELREALAAFDQEKRKQGLLQPEEVSPWTYKNSAGN